MKDYVSRQAVIEAMMKASTPAFDKNGKPTFLVDYVKTMECLPSADVEAVVRCKDCNNSYIAEDGNRICKQDEYTGIIVTDNDYCSLAERRESE